MNNLSFLALGSNIGDKECNLINAIRLISSINDTEVATVSNIYETEPVGYANQDTFLNMAIGVETFLEPLRLLDELQKIENALKRTREIHWGPRTIDIDILLYKDIKLDLPKLKIPHPRMFERAFVLVPMKDIYNYREINGKGIDELIDKCNDKDGIKLYREFTIDSLNML